VRFPGKPLVDIAGKPMVVRTWERAALAKTLDALVVATDDDKIAAVCRDAGAQVVMTSLNCANGGVYP
jgi:3-deoxy-manno-octulosonate cytidylyltransferase (CMP-KDO synthetase)